MPIHLLTDIFTLPFSIADICDSNWQFSKDGLITSAFVLSATAMVVIVATILVAIWAFKKKRKDKYEPEVGYLM